MNYKYPMPKDVSDFLLYLTGQKETIYLEGVKPCPTCGGIENYFNPRNVHHFNYCWTCKGQGELKTGETITKII